MTEEEMKIRLEKMEDEREDWAAMYAWSYDLPMASGRQLSYIKDLERQKCLSESDYKKGERPEPGMMTAKRADILIRRGLKRQKEMKLQKAKEASCY